MWHRSLLITDGQAGPIFLGSQDKKKKKKGCSHHGFAIIFLHNGPMHLVNGQFE